MSHDAQSLLRLAVEAEADPRTVRRALREGPAVIRTGVVRERVRRVLREHALVRDVELGDGDVIELPAALACTPALPTDDQSALFGLVAGAPGRTWCTLATAEPDAKFYLAYGMSCGEEETAWELVTVRGPKLERSR